MTPHAFEHNEDPYRFIVQARHGIDIDAVAVSGDIDRIAHVQRLLDGLAEVYTMGFEDGERLATITDWPVIDLVAELRTDFLLALHRGDADLREVIVTTSSFFNMFGGDLGAFRPEFESSAVTLYIQPRREGATDASFMIDAFGTAVLQLLFGWLIGRSLTLDRVEFAARTIEHDFIVDLQDHLGF